MTTSNGVWTERAFIPLLTDAIEHTALALADEIKKHPASIARFSRSAILSAAFSVECAANVCISELKISKKLREGIDRLGLLDKLEVFVQLCRGQNVFQRGCVEVQRIDELVTLRNDFVHPKVANLKANVSPEQRTAVVQCGTHHGLSIDKSFRTWDGNAALTVLRAIEAFFNKYFLEWCEWSASDAVKRLTSNLVHDDRTVSWGHPGERESFAKAKALWELEFNFLDVDAIAGGVDDEALVTSEQMVERAR